MRRSSIDLKTTLRILGDLTRAGFIDSQRLPGINTCVPSLLDGKQVPISSTEAKSLHVSNSGFLVLICEPVSSTGLLHPLFTSNSIIVAFIPALVVWPTTDFRCLPSLFLPTFYNSPPASLSWRRKSTLRFISFLDGAKWYLVAHHGIVISNKSLYPGAAPDKHLSQE